METVKTLEELETEYTEISALIDGLPKWAEGQAALTERHLSNIRYSFNRELHYLEDKIAKAKQALGLADDFADLNEQAAENRKAAIHQCYGEIIQRIAWLIDDLIGGRGIKDYFPENHSTETNEKIVALQSIMEIMYKYSGAEHNPMITPIQTAAQKILETAKAYGQANITPGHKLFITEHFKKNQIIDLDDTHRIEVTKDGIFKAPFIFVATSDISGGQPDIAQCANEKNALYAIETILLNVDVF